MLSLTRLQEQTEEIYPELQLCNELVFLPLGFKISKIQREVESTQYCACAFSLNGAQCRFRVGKVTPKKVGFFATLWKRSEAGPIAPFDRDDPVDLSIFYVCDKERMGLFVFSKALLIKKGVISKGGVGGKRALRLYPSWSVPTNEQARKSQIWQCESFLDIDIRGRYDATRVRKVFSS